MKELSLHILDIVENAIAANGTFIEINIEANKETDRLSISIKDNGKGMEEKTVAMLTDPFFTSRTTRKVGLGLPLLKAAAESCNGSLDIFSFPGIGTEVRVVFQESNIDRMPNGDQAGTILTLLVGAPEICWYVIYRNGDRKFELDSRYFTEELGGIPFSNPVIIKWLREFIQEGILEVQDEPYF